MRERPVRAIDRPAWWVYAVAFAVTNGLRQLALVAADVELPLLLGVASWAATGLLTVVAVTLVARRFAPPSACR